MVAEFELSTGGLQAEPIGSSYSASGWRLDKGQMRLFEKYRYFFFITNDRKMTAAEVVLSANDRCNQENLIAQLKGGVHALTTPVDDLMSNWAYMVMASLAWSLKAWAALLVPEVPRHAAKHRAEKQTLLRMEFRTFCAAMIEMPCQIVRSGRRLIYRLLSWNPWQGVFLRLVERLHGLLAVLKHANLKPGSGCPGPRGPSRRREGTGYGAEGTAAVDGVGPSGQ